MHVGGGIVKVDGFLNHQVDARLIMAMGERFAERFGSLACAGINKVLTAEVSGIAPALATAHAFDVPLVYARKHRSAVMTDVYYLARATSRTQTEQVDLMISKNYLLPGDRVLLIDDFLATGSTIRALCELVGAGGATLMGIGCVIEKPVEKGRQHLDFLRVPIESLATVEVVDEQLQVS